MRVTGEVTVDDRLKARLDKTSGGNRKNLTDSECSSYVDFYREDIPTLIATIGDLKGSLQDIASIADMIFEHAQTLKEKNAEGLFFSDTIRILYAEIVNKLSKHGLSRREQS